MFSMERSSVIEIEEVGRVLLEKSKRSSRLNIFVMPFKGVRVAVPRRVSLEDAERIVRSKRGWIKKSLARMRSFERRHVPRAPTRAALLDEDKGRSELAARVNRLAQRHGFVYGRLYIRRQKTRWGSCSPKNDIRLNIKLLCLPDELADYVILHELMHTRIKNHQKEFWKSLDAIVGDSRKIDSQLRKYYLEMV